MSKRKLLAIVAIMSVLVLASTAWMFRSSLGVVWNLPFLSWLSATSVHNELIQRIEQDGRNRHLVGFGDDKVWTTVPWYDRLEGVIKPCTIEFLPNSTTTISKYDLIVFSDENDNGVADDGEEQFTWLNEATANSSNTPALKDRVCNRPLDPKTLRYQLLLEFSTGSQITHKGVLQTEVPRNPQ